MQPIRVVSGTAVPLDRSDVDTDQIIPSDWLKRVERTGFGEGLFSEWRESSDFVLNRSEYQARACSSLARTSGPVHRASTRRGRWRTTGSAPSSRRGSRTSSGTTA